jgi:3-carboxy-cis,cis-muconate cycloisomerase
MPHKRNPLGAAVAIAAATRAPGLVATMLAAMPQEHQRGLGGWHAEWNTLPELVRITAGAANAVADALEHIEADPERMAANLAITDGLISSEAVTMALAERIGREAAHALVGAACRRADAEGRGLGAVLSDDAGVKVLLTAEEIAALVDPARGGGAAAELVERTVRRLRRDRPGNA